MINTQAPVVVTTSIDIDASPQDVWRVLGDINHWPEWYERIDAAKLEGELVLGSVIVWQAGAQHIESKLTAVEPGRRLDWRGSGDGMVGLHSWELNAHDGGTRVNNSESVEGGYAATNSASMQTMLADMIGTWNARLKARVESKS